MSTSIRSIDSTEQPVVVALCESPVFVFGSTSHVVSMLVRALGRHPSLRVIEQVDVAEFLGNFGLKDEETVQHWNLPGHYESNANSPLSVEGGWPQYMTFMGDSLNALLTQQSLGLRWVLEVETDFAVLNPLPIMFSGARFICVVDGHPATAFVQEPQPKECHAALEFAKAHHGRCFMAPYSDMIQNSQSYFVKILRFLGEASHSAPVDYFMTELLHF